jgi:hypothetical protein
MASVRLFRNTSFGGSSLLIDNIAGSRYMLATGNYLFWHGFVGTTSSLRLRTSTPDVQSTCLLFDGWRFNGGLRSFAYTQNRDVASLPGFGDRTASVLLMNHPPGKRSTFALRSLAGSQLNSAIDTQLAGVSEVSRSGAVLLRFTIDAHEIDRYGDDIMLVQVPIRIHTPWPFSDYSAQIRYWIKFFIDGQHRVRGFVCGWGYWIEGGILTGSIESRLRPQVQSNIGVVESQLNAMLQELSFHRWTDVYLMPGAASVTGDYSAHANDDCTLVLPHSGG